MGGGKKKHTAGLGKAILHSKKKIFEENRKFHNSGKHILLEGAQLGVSCLQSNNLSDFLAKAELANQEFNQIRGKVELVDKNVVESVVKKEGMRAEEARKKGLIVPIPHRPFWTSNTDAEDLEQAEHDSFLEWRKTLAYMEEEHGFIMTPFERNIDFWRQLWRVVEKSDLVCQILDCRDPLFYRCLDLEDYVRSYSTEKRHLENPNLPSKYKRNILIMNKADLMPQEIRRKWKKYFDNLGIPCVFFSAVRELQKLDILTTETKVTGKLFDNRDELKAEARNKILNQIKEESESDGEEKLNNDDINDQVRDADENDHDDIESELGQNDDLLSEVDVDDIVKDNTISDSESESIHSDTKISLSNYDNPTKSRSDTIFNTSKQGGGVDLSDKALKKGNHLIKHEKNLSRKFKGVMSLKGDDSTYSNGPTKEQLELEDKLLVGNNPNKSRGTHHKNAPIGFAALLDSESDSDSSEDSDDAKSADSKDEDAESESVNSDTESPQETESDNDDDCNKCQELSNSTQNSSNKTQIQSQTTTTQTDITESRIDDHILDCDELMSYLQSQIKSLAKEIATKDTTALNLNGQSESLPTCGKPINPILDHRPVIGFIGFPNVGKSSIINALFGQKKVSMSRQPGKTKHFQTLEVNTSLSVNNSSHINLTNSQSSSLEPFSFTLCDCPGLVFPSLVATKAHLVINSTMPIDQIIGGRNDQIFLQPVKLIVEKFDNNTKKLYDFYGIKKENILPMRGCQVVRFLASFATDRKKFLRDKVPDDTWAARRVMKDFCEGKLVHCELPPITGPQQQNISDIDHFDFSNLKSKDVIPKTPENSGTKEHDGIMLDDPKTSKKSKKSKKERLLVNPNSDIEDTDSEEDEVNDTNSHIHSSFKSKHYDPNYSNTDISNKIDQVLDSHSSNIIREYDEFDEWDGDFHSIMNGGPGGMLGNASLNLNKPLTKRAMRRMQKKGGNSIVSSKEVKTKKGFEYVLGET